MADDTDTPAIFNLDAANRIRAVVKTVEAMRRDLAARIQTQPTPGKRIVWVKITGKAAGHAKYVGKIFHTGTAAMGGLPPGDLDSTSDLTTADLGSTTTDEYEILIINIREAGQSTWDLWDGVSPGDNASLLPSVFLGTVHSQNSDGKLIIMIDGWKSLSCG